MIKVLPANIESANAANPIGVNPKNAAVKKDDKQETFGAELEHFLGTVREEQKTSQRTSPQDRFSNRAAYVRTRINQKGRVGILFPGIMRGQRNVHYLRIPNNMEKLHGKRAKAFTTVLRQKAKILYLKKRSSFDLQQTAKDKKPHLKLLKHLDHNNEVTHKNQKNVDQAKRDLGLENNGGRNSRILKGKKWLTLYKKQKEQLNAAQKGVTRISSENSKTGGAKDLTFVCTRYENNVPTRVHTGSQLQALHYTNGKNDDIFSEIVKQFTLIVNKGGGEARIVLEPQTLGNIKLNIKLHNSEVNTHIVVDNMTLKDLIQSRLTVLQDSLLSQGFSLGSFSVEVKEQNTSPQMTADTKNAGVGVTKAEEVLESDQQVLQMADLPWISTVVNITV